MALTFIAGVAYGQDNMIAGASGMEAQVVEKNRWAELFEDTDFDVDDPSCPNIELIFQSAMVENVAGQNWPNEIQRLIVGPSAMVHFFRRPDFS